MGMSSLVYHAGALGDFLTALPAVSRYKTGRGRLILLGRPAHGALAAHLFDEVWDAGAPVFAALFSAGSEARAHLAERLRAVESALVFARADSPLASALTELGVTEILRQDPFPTAPIPIVDYHLSLFPGAVAEADRVPRLPVAAAPEAARRGVAIAFGSGSARKNWPRERFREVARRLAQLGEEVRWICGPAEERESSLADDRTWRNLPLTELAERLSRCRLYLGNDSGVTHLASAAGCPVVALFGASDHRIWAPRGQVTIIVSPSGDMADITTGDVVRACRESLQKK
jgi:heptosyltransferase-3